MNAIKYKMYSINVVLLQSLLHKVMYHCSFLIITSFIVAVSFVLFPEPIVEQIATKRSSPVGIIKVFPIQILM